MTFVVRVWFPVGWNFSLLNLQFPYFAQYIALFIVGLIAYRRNWLAGLTNATGKRWLAIGVALIVLFVPGAVVTVLTSRAGSAASEVVVSPKAALDQHERHPGFINPDSALAEQSRLEYRRGEWNAGTAASAGVAESDPFHGGLHWQSAANALWESFLCVSMCIGLIYVFRRYVNRQGRLAKFLSPNAYTAFIIQAPVITAVALVLRNADLYPLLKFGLAALIALPLCFVLSNLIRKLPYTDRVL